MSFIKSQALPTFNHYDSGFKNLIDPTGAWGKGGKGQILPLLGNTKAQDKKEADEAAAAKAALAQPTAGVTYPSAEQQAAAEVDQKKKELGMMQLKTGASTMYNPQKIQ